MKIPVVNDVQPSKGLARAWNACNEANGLSAISLRVGDCAQNCFCGTRQIRRACMGTSNLLDIVRCIQPLRGLNDRRDGTVSAVVPSIGIYWVATVAVHFVKAARNSL